MASGIFTGAFFRFVTEGCSRTGSACIAPPRLTLPEARNAPAPTSLKLPPVPEMISSHGLDDLPDPAKRIRETHEAADSLSAKRTRVASSVLSLITETTTPPKCHIDKCQTKTPSFSSNITSLPSTPVTPKTLFEFPTVISKPTFTCQLCSKDFDRKSNLNKHIRHVHEKQRPYLCELCGKRFGQKSSIDKHVLVVHEKKKAHKCSLCDRAFGQVGDLNVHVRAVHERKKPFGCFTCGATFALKSHVVKHQRVVHEKIRPYKCTLCTAQFGENSDLKKHRRSVHNEDTPASSAPQTDHAQE